MRNSGRIVIDKTGKKTRLPVGKGADRKAAFGYPLGAGKAFNALTPEERAARRAAAAQKAGMTPAPADAAELDSIEKAVAADVEKTLTKGAN